MEVLWSVLFTDDWSVGRIMPNFKTHLSHQVSTCPANCKMFYLWWWVWFNFFSFCASMGLSWLWCETRLKIYFLDFTMHVWQISNKMSDSPPVGFLFSTEARFKSMAPQCHSPRRLCWEPLDTKLPSQELPGLINACQKEVHQQLEDGRLLGCLEVGRTIGWDPDLAWCHSLRSHRNLGTECWHNEAQEGRVGGSCGDIHRI